MIKIKCPECGALEIERINTQVKVYEQFYLEEITDYVIEGGVERPIRYFVVRSNEDEPPYIEELDSNDLEFACAQCGYFFEGCKTEADLIERAEELGLTRWVE